MDSSPRPNNCDHCADVSNAGGFGNFNATVEGKFGEADSSKLLGDQVKISDPNRTARPIKGSDHPAWPVWRISRPNVV
jgi:hypothetical protein